MKQILSKSTFMYGCQCHKRLYLSKYHKNLANPEDETTELLFQKGTEAGVLAQQLFPGGANAQGDDAWHSYKSVERTQKLLPVYSVIYEAAFMYEGVLCAVDILVRKGKDYYVYEVKSTNSVKPQHITDAALQYEILSRCGIQIADFSIVHFNKNYVRKGALDVQQLFTPTSVYYEIQDELGFIQSKIQELKAVLAQPEIPQIEMGPQCDNPYPCNFSLYCSSLLPPAPPEPEPDKTIYTEPQSVSEFLNSLVYPLYFFDFETVMYGVPEYDLSTPYQQIPFQYSLHVIEKPGAELRHTYFLGDGISDPRPELIQQLINDTGPTGSILVWNRPFEKSCLEKLALFFTEYATALQPIIDRLVDLMVPFKQKVVVSEAFYGSASIKNVLPVVVPELSYANLTIQEGGTASHRYAQLNELKTEEQALVRSQLLEYCHLDTLAMVKIWEYLKSV